MTKKQLATKLNAARRTCAADIGDGCTLYYHGDGWSIEHKTGNTIATCTHSPEKYFDFLLDGYCHITDSVVLSVHQMKQSGPGPGDRGGNTAPDWRI